MAAEKIFYDLMPDNSVSVYMFGDWDFFSSYNGLISYLNSNGIYYKLIDITNTTLDERLEIMGIQP
ncbi:hypothetical protein [Vibrio diazotrophicus]|uniref:hypothetical protein n=1 Tax=Vibrio diazotrophicus TaxID=685 RepID=UPI000C9E9CA7|nr:hypothetical protein [Vibrio diazotrophicus]PNH81983.1 hypothetical protein C1N27_04605 [Vibrio diazotrophicus]